MRMQHGVLALVAVSGAAVALLAETSVAGEDAPSIVHLEFRDHVVTIHASPQGPLYSVQTRAGDSLGDNLTEEELLAAHPELSERIRSGHAGAADGSFIWAGRDERLVEPADSAIDSE